MRCPKRPRLRRFFPAGEIDAAAAYIARGATNTDVYLGVAPRHRTAVVKEGFRMGLLHYGGPAFVGGILGVKSPSG